MPNKNTIVTIETMPDHLRESHRAAGNWGRYPANGADRIEMSRAEADEIVAADEDEYDHIVDTQMTDAKHNATISERGNGLDCEVGSYVAEAGTLYRVIAIGSHIHTGGCGDGNYVYATVEEADWSDCPEGEESTCVACVETDDSV